MPNISLVGPVPSDWITIAVATERGPIKLTRAPVMIEADDGDNKDGKKKGRSGVNEEKNT